MKAPRLIYSNAPSRCCKSKAVLVCSRQGGFVSRNCLKCGKPDYVVPAHLPDLQCERCDGPLKIEIIEKNYVYWCEPCDVGWPLATYLPDWSDLFPYCELAAPGDPEFWRVSVRPTHLSKLRRW